MPITTLFFPVLLCPCLNHPTKGRESGDDLENCIISFLRFSFFLCVVVVAAVVPNKLRSAACVKNRNHAEDFSFFS